METIVKLFDQQKTKSQKHIKFNGELALPINGRDRAQYYLDFMFGSIFSKQATTTELCSQYGKCIEAITYQNQLGHAVYVSGVKSVSTKKYVDDYFMFMGKEGNGLTAVLIEKDGTSYQCTLKVVSSNSLTLKYLGKLPFLVKADNLISFNAKKHREGNNTYGAAGDARSLGSEEIKAMYGKSAG